MPDPATPLIALPVAGLDTETTGLDPRRDRLIELALIPADGAPPLISLADPGLTAMPAAARAVHGLDPADLVGAPSPGALLARLPALLGARVVVGHALAFDLALLAAEAERAGLAWTPPAGLCTQRLAVLAFPEGGVPDLETLARRLRVPLVEPRHRAEGDARTALALLAALLPPLRARGLRTLGEVEAALAAQPPAVTLAEPAPVPSTPLTRRVDAAAWLTPLSRLLSRPPVTVPATAPLEEAARRMSAAGIGALLVDLAPPGIVTERDLVRAVAAEGAAALARPVAAVMSRPVETLPGTTPVVRARARMARLGIRHLGVTDSAGVLVGVVSQRALLTLDAGAAAELDDALAAADDAAGLAAAWARLVPAARGLRADGLDAAEIAGVIAEEIRALVARAAALVAAGLARESAAPPGAAALIVLGSAGRGEALLSADQDTALILPDGLDAEGQRRWALFGARHAALLDQAGLRLCPGGVMAANPPWRQDAAAWRATVAGWLRRSRPEDVLEVDIFLDAAVAAGPPDLAAAVLAPARQALAAAPAFLKALAAAVATMPPPLGWFGLARDDGGRTDLKRGALLPLVTAARVLGLAAGAEASGTPHRLRAAAAAGLLPVEEAEDLCAAFAFCLGLVLDQQLEDAGRGVPVSARIAAGRLARRDRRLLRQHLASLAPLADCVTDALGRAFVRRG